MMKTKYIISSHNNVIKVFNAMTGGVIRSFKVNGDIVNGPVQSGDQFSVIIKMGEKIVGRIYKLPTCFLLKTFNV